MKSYHIANRRKETAKISNVCNSLRQHAERLFQATFDGVVIRASDLWSTGSKFDSRLCTARL